MPSQASALIGLGMGPLNSKSSASMDLAETKSPFWTESIRAWTVSLLFIILSFIATCTISVQMGLGLNECSLWNILRFPRYLINALFMKCLYQCNILSGHNTWQ